MLDTQHRHNERFKQNSMRRKKKFSLSNHINTWFRLETLGEKITTLIQQWINFNGLLIKRGDDQLGEETINHMREKILKKTEKYLITFLIKISEQNERETESV